MIGKNKNSGNKKSEKPQVISLRYEVYIKMIFIVAYGQKRYQGIWKYKARNEKNWFGHPHPV